MGERKGTGFWVFGFFFVRAWVDGRDRMGFGISVRTQKEVHPPQAPLGRTGIIGFESNVIIVEIRREEKKKRRKTRKVGWGIGGLSDSPVACTSTTATCYSSHQCPLPPFQLVAPCQSDE